MKPRHLIILWVVALALVVFLNWPARGAADVGVYAHVVVCTHDLLLCDLEPPVRHDTWRECEWYLVFRKGIRYKGVIMGECRSWSPPFDWRKE